MPTLFVGCADTLYSRRLRPGLQGADAWEPNWEVVSAIERWIQTGLGPVIVWSGASERDADLWRRRVIPHLPGISAIARDLRLPKPGDVMIDALKLDAPGTCYQPAQSFMVAPSLQITPERPIG